MPKRRIIIKGNIQGVGYRVLVKKIARSLGIKGVVCNLDNGAVDIYCEGNAKSLKRFLEMIDIKRRDGNLLAIDVTKIKTYDEKAKGYGKTKAPKRFTIFDIDYGEDLTFAEKEMIERQELMILGGSQMWNGIDVVGEKIDVVGEKIDSMHEDMNERFLEMNEKYHIISENLVETNKNIERMNENNAKSNENIKEMNQSLAKSNENNARLIENNEKVINALLKMVEDHIEKDHER